MPIEMTAEEREADNLMCKQHTGFTRDELTKAFDNVQNPKDWKDRVDSYCTTDEVRATAAAIEFFTATKAHFDYIGVVGPQIPLLPTPPHNRFRLGDHIMKVRADGYRIGPAGDH